MVQQKLCVEPAKLTTTKKKKLICQHSEHRTPQIQNWIISCPFDSTISPFLIHRLIDPQIHKVIYFFMLLFFCMRYILICKDFSFFFT